MGWDLAGNAAPVTGAGSGARHCAHIEHAAAFNELAIAFLKAHAS